MNEMKTLSKKNTFHLSKNRQREILYFVKQYPEFKSELKEIDGMRSGLIKMDCTRDVRDDSVECTGTETKAKFKMGFVDTTEG